MQAREILKLTKNKVSNVSNRIQRLQSEIRLAAGLTPEQKRTYLKLINERAQLLSILTVQLKTADPDSLPEIKAHAAQLLNIDGDVKKIRDSFEKVQQKIASASRSEAIGFTATNPAANTRATTSTTKPVAPAQKTSVNPRLEAAKRELTHAYMDAHSEFTRMQASLRKISQTVAPSSMANLTIEQKSQRIAFVDSLQKQYKQIEAKVNNIERVLGSMASSVTAAQVVQMKKDVKEISEVSGIIEKRIAKEQVKAMPTAPTGFKKNPPPDEGSTNSNQFRRR